MPDQTSDKVDSQRTRCISPKLPPLRPKRALRRTTRTAHSSYRRKSLKSVEEQPSIQQYTYTDTNHPRPANPPSPNNLHGRSEHEAFQLFTGQALAWFDPNNAPWPADGHMDTIWNPLMLQMMESEPTIKQLLLAWTELHQQSLNGSITLDPTLGILGTRQQIDLSVMLIACVMFCVLDSFRGTKDVFLQHLQSGARMLDDYGRIPVGQAGNVCDHLVARYVRPVFMTLNLNLPMTLEFELWRPGEKVADRLVKLREMNRVLKTWN